MADSSGQINLNVFDEFFGIVEDGEFRPLRSGRAVGDSVRLTTIQMQEAMPPEASELDLTAYEGKVIRVSGHDVGGWIYSARVIAEISGDLPGDIGTPDEWD